MNNLTELLSFAEKFQSQNEIALLMNIRGEKRSIELSIPMERYRLHLKEGDFSLMRKDLYEQSKTVGKIIEVMLISPAKTNSSEVGFLLLYGSNGKVYAFDKHQGLVPATFQEEIYFLGLCNFIKCEI